MVKMIIDRPFILLTDKGERVPFKAGEQDVAPEHAAHWYVQVNGKVLGKKAPKAPDPNAPLLPGAVEQPEDDRAALVVEATELGITVDGRWGIDRVKQEIAEAKAKAKD